MKYNHKIIVVLAFLVFCLVLCGQNIVIAQVTKEINQIDVQNYLVTGSDMRHYHILGESTDQNEYATYYQLIREKIKDRLKNNYRYGYKEGDVDILFTLNPDGSLTKLEVNRDSSTKYGDLVDIVALSAKQASPFPPFPKALPRSPMSFNIKVSFKDDHRDGV